MRVRGCACGCGCVCARARAAHRRVELAQREIAAAARDVKAGVRVHDREADTQRGAVGAQLQARRALRGRGLRG